MTESVTLPADTAAAVPDEAGARFVGRVAVPGRSAPVVVAVVAGTLVDLSHRVATVAELCDLSDATEVTEAIAHGAAVGRVDATVRAACEGDTRMPRLLSPVDLQPVKAAGATFAARAVRRALAAQLPPAAAIDALRRCEDELGAPVDGIPPGSALAERAKDVLSRAGLWTAGLEVSLGPDPEFFAKGLGLAAAGSGSPVGLSPRPGSVASEAEVAVIVSSRGRPVAATLANDLGNVDLEERSALLRDTAKDYPGSCAIGPFLRLFDSSFGLDDVAAETVRISVTGTDGYSYEDSRSLQELSRPLPELVASVFGEHHQYPDGLVLLTGAVAAPAAAAEPTGRSPFAHLPGDRVVIASPRLGTLVNSVVSAAEVPRWETGFGALLRAWRKNGL